MEISWSLKKFNAEIFVENICEDRERGVINIFCEKKKYDNFFRFRHWHCFRWGIISILFFKVDPMTAQGTNIYKGCYLYLDCRNQNNIRTFTTLHLNICMFTFCRILANFCKEKLDLTLTFHHTHICRWQRTMSLNCKHMFFSDCWVTDYFRSAPSLNLAPE